MKSTNNVRHRRQLRIRQIQANTYERPREIQEDISVRNSPKESVELIDERLQDPEYVWKQSMKQRNKSKSHTFRDDYVQPQDQKPRWLFRLRLQMFGAVLMFIFIWVVFQIKHPYALEGQRLIRNSLSTEFDYEKVALWYHDQFNGFPAILPSFRSTTVEDPQLTRSLHIPVFGQVIEPFEDELKGLRILTQAEAPVAAIDEGRVIFVGEREQSGHTVIIQHTNQRQSIYGLLGMSLVRENDWIQGGQQIGLTGREGQTANALLFFSLKEQQKYVDPVELIQFE